MVKVRIFILTKYTDNRLDSNIGVFQFIEDAIDMMNELNKRAEPQETYKIESHLLGHLQSISQH